MDNLELKIGLNSSAVKSGVAAVRGQLEGLREAAVGIFTGAAGGLALSKLFDGALERAKDIHGISLRFGDTPEEVQRLGAAVRKVGGDMETAAKGGFKAFLEAQKAVSGDQGARAHFEALGISLEKLAELHGPRDTLIALADAVQHATDQHAALAAAGEIVGSRQASLIQLFRLGGDAMRKAGNDAIVMSDNTVESLVRVEKGLGRVKNSATNIFGNLLVGAHDVLGKAFESMGSVVGTAFNAVVYGPKAALETLDQKLAEIDAKYRNGPGEEGKGVKGSIAEGEADTEAEKKAEEIARLKERLHEDELSRQRDLMALDEKRNSLIKERVHFLQEAGVAGFDTAAGLQKRIEAERLLREIQRVDKEKADAQARAEEEAAKARQQAAKAAEDIAKKKESLEDKAFRNALDGLSDEEKINALTQKRLDLLKRINEEKDESTKLDLAGKALDIEREIGNLARKDKTDERARRDLAVGDLTRHGLGGIAYFDRGNSDPAKQTAKAALKTAQLTEQAKRVLERIEQNTKNVHWGR